MASTQGRSFRNDSYALAAVVSGAFLLVFSSACRDAARSPSPPSNQIVKIGVGQIQINEFINNYTLEALARVGPDGQMVPRLAREWILSSDKLSLSVMLRPGVRFHDGSPVSAELIAGILKARLKGMGTAVDDVLSVEAVADDRIEIKLRQPSRFVIEALEATIEKPGSPGVGTGPFAASGEPGKLRANAQYYLGPPSTEGIEIKSYPSLRTSWADFLRGGLDVIYEVGRDARDLLASSSAVKVVPFPRPYQYVVLINSRTAAGRSAAVRRALNNAIDRQAFVRDALGSHGKPSLGPVWPRHWAARADWPTFSYDPESAAAALASEGRRISLNCIVTPGDERVALVVKRQLQAVGVDMTFEERPVPDTAAAIRTGEFDAVLAAANSGPSLLRSYDWWHSKGQRNSFRYANASVDTALDAIRHAVTDEQYRLAVGAFQKSIVEDPPAIFLAWDEVARLASSRLDTQAENGTDMMGTVRLWRIGNPGLAAN